MVADKMMLEQPTKEKTMILARKKMAKKSRDRVSYLPESILLHILCFLDMKDVVRNISFVSSRCRYLWKSVPVLHFDLSSWTRKRVQIALPSKARRITYEYTDFVTKVLKFRENRLTITKIHVSRISQCHKDQILDWLVVSDNCYCREVRLEYKKETFWYTVPEYRVLSTNIKTLHLTNFQFGNWKREFVLNFPHLESLFLVESGVKSASAVKILKISAPKLENLVIQNKYYKYCAIEISTPKLRSWNEKGLCYKEYSLDNLSALVSANIDCRSEVLDNVDTQKLMNVLNSVYNVETLQLSLHGLEPISNCNDLAYEFSHRFQNLRCLKLLLGSSGSSVHLVMNLLRSSPCLEYLVFEITDCTGSCACLHDGITSQFYHLKHVEIQNIKGYEIELKFLQVLVENTKVLETLTISKSDIHIGSDQFQRKLRAIARSTKGKVIRRN